MMSATDTGGRPALNFNTRSHHSRLRVLVMVVVGLGAALAAGTLKSWAYAPAMGWAAASLTYLIWV